MIHKYINSLFDMDKKIVKIVEFGFIVSMLTYIMILV